MVRGRSRAHSAGRPRARDFASAQFLSALGRRGPALVDGSRRLPRVAWRYPAPPTGAEVLPDRVAFYASHLDCQVDGLPVRPQAGGLYGGWITAELVGPFKGEPGSESW